MKAPVSCFFLGKGGVGKSTASALFSIYQAKQDQKVLLASMDPAHNLSDIFGIRLSDKPTIIRPNLAAIEVDQEKWIKKYLKNISRQIKRSYSYLTAFNLEGYFDVIRFSPGLEEYALILAFQEMREKFKTNDFIVFDMPPTALSLKFFCLPALSLVWTEKLLNFRKEIITKRDLITKIKLIKKEYETDKVLKKIMEQEDYFKSLKRQFQDSGQTKIKLVLNPDDLSIAESERIAKRLRSIKVDVDDIYFNKARLTSNIEDVGASFNSSPCIRIPFSESPLIGYDKLEAFITTTGISF